MDNYFVFNGISSMDMGLVVEKVPGRRIAEKDMERFQVAGRSEPLHIWKQSWKPYPVKYKCWFRGTSPERQLHEIAEWLHSAPVRSRLEDSYDGTVFRYATYQGGADVDVLMREVGRFTVEFEVGAQAYLKKYENGVLFSGSGGAIFNPGSFPTKPLIRVMTDGVRVGGAIKIGAEEMGISWATLDEKEIWVDCEEREAWQVVGGENISTNFWIYGADYLTIQPGSNAVEFSGGIKSATIFSRAYTL